MPLRILWDLPRHRRTRTSWVCSIVEYRAKGCSHHRPSVSYRRACGVVYVNVHEQVYDGVKYLWQQILVVLMWQTGQCIEVHLMQIAGL